MLLNNTAKHRNVTFGLTALHTYRCRNDNQPAALKASDRRLRVHPSRLNHHHRGLNRHHQGSNAGPRRFNVDHPP